MLQGCLCSRRCARVPRQNGPMCRRAWLLSKTSSSIVLSSVSSRAWFYGPFYAQSVLQRLQGAAALRGSHIKHKLVLP